MRCAFFLLIILLGVPVCPAKAQFLTGYGGQDRREIVPESSVPGATHDFVEAVDPVPEPVFQPLMTRGHLPVAAVLPDLTPVEPSLSDAPPPDSAPVDFQAAQLDYDDINNVITASGDVFLEQSGRILRADIVEYDLNKDVVKARGHVVLNEINGDIHYADEVEFKDQFKDGVVRELASILEDGSRFAAENGQRFGGVKTVMHEASYTACEPCKGDPERAPIWQIRADQVTHDKEARRVAYEDATFELWGVPVMYLPYFSHADPSVKQKSGFLAPSAGFKSDQGFFAQSDYYWAIAPDQDATVGLTGFTKENPLLKAQWRKRFERALIELNGGITYSQRTENSTGVNRRQDDEVRGHVLAYALWNINDRWRAGADVQWASDDQYMRQYDFVNDNVLTSEIYAERFTERDYFTGRLIKFQDVRVRDLQEDQPEILPELVASFKGNPAGVPWIGGQWSFDGSYLGLRRGGSRGQDYDRLSLSGGWARHLVSDIGLLTDIGVSARQDVYHVRDRDVATPGSGRSGEATDIRFFPQAQLTARYPFVRDFDTMQVQLEPVVSVTAASHLNDSDDVPNEDSRDVQLDAHNLFNANRFPGLDRIEDQSRVTYGLRSGLYHGAAGEIRTFLGQSYRFDNDDNPFPRGSGLSFQSSDVVGEIAALYDDYSVNYRFQLDSRHLTSQRHEVDAAADFGRFNVSSRYLFAKGLSGTDLDESREQFRMDMGYYWDENWQSRAGFTQDLGADPGLRQAYLGVNYFGQCLFWSLTGQRNVTDDASGESDIEVLFRIGLKTLGEFEETRFYD